jgi:hypothetical protein
MNWPKNYLKSHSTKALRSAIRQIGSEWRMNSRHQSAVRKTSRFLQGAPLRLNLGSGPNAKKGWINIDLFDREADLQLDLREPWPFPDKSVSHIYNEHVFEHFELHDEVPHFLSEALRVLHSGGLFDVGVPDTEWPLHAYGNAADYYWRFAKTILPKWCETQLDFINYHFRQDREHGEHKYAWDEETLARSLQRSGFTRVLRRQFEPGLDSDSRRTGTLYMRAIKP